MANDIEKRITAKMVLDSTGFNNSLKGVNSQLAIAKSEFKLASEGIQAFGKDSDKLIAVQESLAKQIDAHSKKVDIWKNSIEKTTDKMNDNIKEREKLKQSLVEEGLKHADIVKQYGKESEEAEKSRNSLKVLGDEYKRKGSLIESNTKQIQYYEGNMNRANAELTKAQGELKKVNEELSKQQSKWLQAGETLTTVGDGISGFGEKASKLGGTLTKSITLPVMGFGAAAVKSQIDFESAFAGVTKTVDGTKEQLAALEQGIKNMSLTLPSSAEEIAGVAEAAGQLGIQTDNVLGFTKVIIDLGNATNLVGEEGASQLAKFANITQMSQKDFDRLGSTIVALGNNSATTEADIVSMGMRLAGAGHQVKMSEAQIMGLAASLSSVGIEAEAGGSAFSKVMVDIQLAVETNSEKLKDFAKVAGMSTSEFSKAFKQDAVTAITAFIKGLGTAEQRGQSAIAVLDSMGITEIRLRDSLLRAAGAGDLFNDTIALGSKAWEENTALANEANQRYATTESQLKIMKNEVADVAREVGVELLPIVKDGLIVIKDVIKGFKDLSPETKENIVKFALLSATLGPVIGGVGKFAEGIGGVLSLAGKFSTSIGAAKIATEGVGAAATVAGGAGGVAGLTSSLGGFVLGAAPYVAAGVAVVGAGYAIYKGLNEDIIPEVDLFANKIETTAVATQQAYGTMGVATETTVTKISEGTKKAVGAYVDLDDNVKKEMQELYLNSTEISENIKNDMTGKFNQMATQVIQGYEKQKNDSVSTLQDMFMNSSTITSKEQADILAQTNRFYEDRKISTQNHENSINAIINKASGEKRTLTQNEVDQITALQNAMRENAVKALSDNEVEAKVILQRMKDYDGRVTAEQAAQHIQQLNSSRDKAVQTANDEYEKRIELIERMKAEGVIKSQEQADQMINEAKRQRDGIVDAAERTRIDAIDKIRQMNDDLDSQVDTGSGEILSTWDKLKRWWTGWKPESKSFEYAVSSRPSSSRMTGAQEYMAGTLNAPGGISMIHDNPSKSYGEIVDLPRGTRVYPHDVSIAMAKETARNVVDGVLKSLNLNNNSSGDTIVNVYSPKALSESETARQFKKANQELALGL